MASHTHLKGSRTRWSVLLGIVVVFAFGATAPALGMNNESGSSTPWIASDKADYAPGELVTLNGGNWAAGESVHIYVNDDAGKTWERDVDVTASPNGTITDSFNLPDWFVATYSVRATGSSGAVATTTFTDGNFRFLSSGPTLSSVNWQKFSDSSCSTAKTDAGNSGSGDITTTDASPGTLQVGVDTAEWIGLTAPASAGGQSFVSWVATSGSPTFTTSGAGNRTICVAGDNSSGLRRLTANYATPADTTPPVVTPTVVGTLGNNGWYTSNVSLTWSVVDNESTITSQTGCGAVSITADQNATTYTCSATSAGGTNSESVTIKRDATAPGIAFSSHIPAANADGWNKTDVTVTWNCTDALSGPVSATVTDTKTTEGEHTASGTCTDGAGNSASANRPVKIDKTAPVLTASALRGPPPGTAYTEDSWTNQDVSVTFSCTDAGGSGVKAGSPTGNATFTTEGDHTANGQCEDVAGNTSTDNFGVKIDKTAPTLAISGKLHGTSTNYVSGTWTNQDVDVSFSCTDTGGSGVKTSSVPANETATATKAYSETCMDEAGNTSPLAGFQVNIDKTAPVLTASAVKGTAPGFAGATAYTENAWTNQDVKVSYSCTDSGGSGVAAGSPSPASETFTTEGSHTSNSSCSDTAGNSDTETFGVNIDKTAPTITCGPTPTFYLGQPAPTLVIGTLSDALSGPASAPVSAAADTSLAGGGTVTLNGSDVAGNAATPKSCPYNINRIVFKQPIDVNAINIAKSGRVIPIKVNVYTNNVENQVGPVTLGMPVAISCASGLPADAVEEYAAGSSNNGLNFRWETTFWIYNFDTSNVKLNNCYNVNVSLAGNLAGSFKVQITK